MAIYVPLMREANALMVCTFVLVLYILVKSLDPAKKTMFEMLAQMAITCYICKQRMTLWSLHICTGSHESSGGNLGVILVRICDPFFKPTPNHILGL